jgi:threonylcarbamoyladenosine tRNA methylthiotransferase MtaB
MYPKVYFFTFGCKVNFYETECLRENFAAKGFFISDSEDDADIFIINTCTVTDTGDSKFFKLLRRLRRDYENAVIAAVGCFPQAFPEKITDADIIAGTKNRAALPDLVINFLYNKERIIQIEEYGKDDKFEQMTNREAKGHTRAYIKSQNGTDVSEPMKNFEGLRHTRAYLKIQDGCNCNCSYCIIPKSRGSFRSKPLEDIIDDTIIYRDKGFREIVITGINIAFWGIRDGLRLSDAVKAIAAAAPDMRIRLGSLEPERLDFGEIDILSGINNLCPHFHLSLQSGCERTLREMGRRYTPAEYESIFHRLRDKFPNCGITTDIMAGFPGETDTDFDESNRFIANLPFSDLNVFPFSPRKGTKAYERTDKISEEIKHRRAAMLRETADTLRKNFLTQQIGTLQTVLFEKEKTEGIPNGYTENYTFVKLDTKTDHSMRNELHKVRIMSAESDFCRAEIERV